MSSNQEQQHTERFIVENDNMDSDTEAKSEMSLKSRSFLHRVNDQVRNRQKQSSKDATKNSDKRSVIWGMFMSSTLQASVFMVKNYSDNLHSIKNTEDLTMQQMFDMSEKLRVGQSDEIYGVTPINWEDSLVHCPEERSKGKEVEYYLYTSVPMGIRLKLFFAQLLLLISSVFTEQSQMCVQNVKPAMLEQCDLFWQDNLTHCLCQV